MTKKADLLLTNAIVLTMDENLTSYEPGAVAIKGDSILQVGAEADLRQEISALEELDCGGKVLMPGLVNAHTHVPMTLLRGLADDLRLDVWLLGLHDAGRKRIRLEGFCQAWHSDRLR